MISPELNRYLRRALAKAGTTQKGLAKALGLTESRVSKLLARKTDDTLSVEKCIELAIFLDEPDPLNILKAADKEPLASLLQTYVAPTTLSPSEQALLDDWRALDPADQPYWAFLIRRAARSRR